MQATLTSTEPQHPARLLLLGLGAIGKVHAQLIRRDPRCVLAGVVDPTESARTSALAWGVPCFDALDTALSSLDLDGVIVATPNQMHATQTLSCMARGLPVLLEKPATATIEEGWALVRQVESTNAAVLVGHHRAHSAIMRQVLDVIASGQLGRIVSVVGSAQFHKPTAYFTDGIWRTQKGGGPVLINLIHEVHNLRMMCGEILAVQATSSNAVRGHAVEDTAAINFEFESGALATFMVSDTVVSPHSWELTSGENPDYALQSGQDCYWIGGTRGSLAVPSMQLHTQVDGQQSWFSPITKATLPTPQLDPLVAQLNHFVAVIQGQEKPLVSVRDGVTNLAVIDAIDRARATGQRTTVEVQGT